MISFSKSKLLAEDKPNREWLMSAVVLDRYLLLLIRNDEKSGDQL